MNNAYLLNKVIFSAVLLALASSTSLRPEDFGACKADGETLCTPAIKAAITACTAQRGCLLEFRGPGTYLTQAFNLTDNIELKLGANATILGTSEDRYNLDPSGWPVLPWPEYPSLATRPPSPAFQAVVRGEWAPQRTC